MRMNEFVGHVQQVARLAHPDLALNATRATLETLAERLGADESRHLAAQLPAGIGRFLDARDGAAEDFSQDEFLKRVSVREGVEPPAAVDHARAVLDTIQQAVPRGELREVLGRLSADYAPLFAGRQGKPPHYGAGF